MRVRFPVKKLKKKKRRKKEEEKEEEKRQKMDRIDLDLRGVVDWN